MEIDDLKFVVGEIKENKPATIRFFGAVNECTTSRFNEEFLFLQDCVHPSKIVVMINSEGGSILHGMSSFSIIQSCPIEVDCIIEGIAASMGSVLWLAGDNCYMHDYSLLMIHNPFNSCGDSSDANAAQMVSAFKSQLETIYRKRLGMAKEQVAKIMDGEEGVDGTFFTAKEAVKAGFIPASHVIKTTKQICEKVKSQIEGVDDYASLRDIMSSISAEIDENKLLENIEPIHNRKDNITLQHNDKMENEETLNLDALSAQLGVAKDAQAAAVSARVAELVKAEATLKETQAKLDDLTIKYNGKEAELNNVKNELDEAKAALKIYKDAEAAALEAEIESVVDSAIAVGKIDETSRANWIEMAHGNFALVKDTLASIRGRENIVETIATDPENIEAINNTLKTVEEEMAAKVKAHLGEVKFEKF